MAKVDFKFPEDLLELSLSLRKFIERYQATRFKIVIDRDTETQNISISILHNQPTNLSMVEEATALFHHVNGEPRQTIELDKFKWYQGWRLRKTIHIRENGKSPYFIAIES